MSHIKDLSSAAGLAELNTFLSTRSYVEGYKASHADQVVVHKLHTTDFAKYPHVARWFYHILSLPCAGGVCKGAAAAGSKSPKKSPAAKPAKSPKKSPAKKPAAKEDDDDDFAMTLDGDSDDDMEELLAKKKADMAAGLIKVKAGPVAKSTLVLDIKPNDSDTDLKMLEKKIREEVVRDGLVWGTAEQVPIAYGIKKLRFAAVVEDEKVSTDDLQESIEAWEDLVQSTDIMSFNKL